MIIFCLGYISREIYLTVTLATFDHTARYETPADLKDADWEHSKYMYIEYNIVIYMYMYIAQAHLIKC